jgi:cysteinyl-tRNA synthetase
MDDDLNISGAMAAIFDLVHAGNKALSAGKVTPAEASAVLELWEALDQVLGILQPPKQEIPSEVEALLVARTKARAEKDWAESDRIRDRLTQLGWTVKDTPEGPKLRRL